MGNVMKNLMVLIFLLLLSGVLLATERSVVLSIPGMNCPVCPITIKKSLQKVDGVKAVDVNFESKLADVTFDDDMTDLEHLKQATANVGYPSQLLGKEGHGK
jgi:mercuric ion binding protein